MINISRVLRLCCGWYPRNHALSCEIHPKRPTREPSGRSDCIATLQGAMLLGKVQRSSRPVEAAMREALEQVERYVIKSRKGGEATKAQRCRPKARDCLDV